MSQSIVLGVVVSIVRGTKPGLRKPEVTSAANTRQIQVCCVVAPNLRLADPC